MTTDNIKTESKIKSWNASLYDQKHRFVSLYGEDVVDNLQPKKGEKILDLGCGTGHLTNLISKRGAQVLGIDYSEDMINQAKMNYPKLHFKKMDAKNLKFNSSFDAVFSNAALHWIQPPEKVIDSVWRALKPGGRFVAEFGGKGNVEKIYLSLTQSFNELFKRSPKLKNPLYFPSISEYGTLLEKRGFNLTYAILFERITPLEGKEGLKNWIKMFADYFLKIVPQERVDEFLKLVEKKSKSELYFNHIWHADYKRLRFIAYKNK